MSCQKNSELGTSCRVTPTSRFPFSQQGMFFPSPRKATVAPKITRVRKKEKREGSGGRTVGRPANSGSWWELLGVKERMVPFQLWVTNNRKGIRRESFSNHWQRLDREVCHSHSLSKNLEKQAQEKDYGILLVLSRFPPGNPYLSLPPVLHGSTILGNTSCVGHREDPWASTPERDLPGLWQLIKRSPELFSKGLVSLCHI